MAYGTVKVDNITFDNSGSDQNVTVSGIYRSLTSGVSVTGTISGAVVIGSTSVSGTTVAGVTVTGTTVQGTSGTFVSLTGTTITGTTISGTTVSATTGTFTSLTGTTITGTTVNGATVNGTTVNGTTVTATTGNFTSLTGTTTTGTTANFVSGVFTTSVSGATVTGTTVQGTTIQGTSGTFVSLTGTTITGTTVSSTTGTFTSLTGTTGFVTTLEVGNASDTTISRSAAGVLAVEGVVIPSISSTNTLTNKTLTDPVIIGTIIEDVFTITDGAAFEVDPSNGSIQLITLGANRTPKATNFVAGESVTLMVDDGTARTLTWTDSTWGTGGVSWKGGVAPSLITSGYNVIQFWKVSTQVYGAGVGNFQ